MDRLLRWVKDIRQATFFDIQNVADYYFSYKAEDAWDTEKDFNIAPPFPFFATRYTLPSSLGPNFGGLENLSVFRVTDSAPAARLTVMAEGVDINPYPPVRVPDARWHIEITTFSAEGRRVSPPVHWFLAIQENGQIARYRDHLAMWLTDMGQQEGVGIIADTFVQVSFLALTFIHCKNVQVLPPPPATKKRLPRKLKFESRYHKIKINAIGQRQAAPERRDPTGISQSLHIVRGHFREYGPDYGKGLLFGKYAGRFWVASHFKGDLATGVVTKDYVVEAPPQETAHA